MVWTTVMPSWHGQRAPLRRPCGSGGSWSTYAWLYGPSCLHGVWWSTFWRDGVSVTMQMFANVVTHLLVQLFCTPDTGLNHQHEVPWPSLLWQTWSSKLTISCTPCTYILLVRHVSDVKIPWSTVRRRQRHTTDYSSLFSLFNNYAKWDKLCIFLLL